MSKTAAAVTDGAVPVTRTVAQPAPLASCSADLAATKHLLGQTRSALEQRVEAQVRFSAASREAALEGRMRPLIEQALAKQPGVTGEVECRGDMCQVRVAAGTRAASKRAWEVLTKDPEIAGLADNFSMDAGEPVVDLATGKGGFETNFYVTTRALDDLSPELEALVTTLRGSAAVRACMRAVTDGATGVLEVKLMLVSEDRRLAVALGGDLAGTEPGNCIAAVLRDAASRFDVPAGVTFGQAYATFGPATTM